MNGRKEVFADALFQTLFKCSPNAALVTRVSDGAILYANEEFYRITGFSNEDVIGKTTLELNLYCNRYFPGKDVCSRRFGAAGGRTSQKGREPI